MAESVIYFVRADRYIKIGTTTNLQSRLTALQNGSPFPLEHILSLPGDVQTERLIQRRFSDLHIRGEWYEDGPELREYIAASSSLQRPAPLPPPPNIHPSVSLPQTVTRPPLFNSNFSFEPIDGTITVEQRIPIHVMQQDIVTHIKFGAYRIIATAMESDADFNLLVTIFYASSKECKTEAARATFSRDKCRYIVTPYVHLFGAFDYAESVHLHPSLEPWRDFPRTEIGADGRPIVNDPRAEQLAAVRHQRRRGRYYSVR